MSKVVVESRIDITHLATIHKYFSSRGYTLRDRSSLIRTVINVYASIVGSYKNVEVFESESDAIEYLHNQGIVFKQGTRSGKSIIRALQEEAIKNFEGANDTIIDMAGVDKDKFDEAMEILREDVDEK